MFRTDTLSPMQAGRLRDALAKRYNFATAGVMTLAEFIAHHLDGASKRIGDHRASYDRRRFNRMTAAEQVAYEKRLARPDYQFRFAGGYAISIPKVVFDALAVPEVNA